MRSFCLSSHLSRASLFGVVHICWESIGRDYPLLIFFPFLNDEVLSFGEASPKHLVSPINFFSHSALLE